LPGEDRLSKETLPMSVLCCVDHPLIQHHMAELRSVDTQPAEFRRLVHRLSVLLAYEATRDLVVSPRQVQTPLAMAEGKALRERIGLIPILRAGLGMVDPLIELIPTAEVWHLGVYRDEATHRPVEYYSRLPATQPVDVALVLDPMLATGGSAVAVLGTLRDWGVRRLKLLAVIAAPEGIRHVQARFPETQIYVAAVDSHLNEHAFIVPGLGDAGDRAFNTQRP
jgi:uracil phosphoribosyltransferase